MPSENAKIPTATSPEPPPHYRWNVRVFAIESTLFFLALNFVSATTILPPLVDRLSGSGVVVGLASGLFAAAWLLPQMFVASAAARIRHKKALVVRAAWPGRIVYLFAAAGIWLLGADHPTATLIVVMVSVVLFFALDAVVGVPWFDLLAKCIPTRQRGRLMGISQAAGSLGGIGVGLFVRYALSENSPWRFPTNYAVLFACAAIVFLIEAVFLSLIREPESCLDTSDVPRPREIVGQIPHLLASDRPFLRLVIVKLVSGFVGVANAFYVLHATRHIGLGPENTGLFVSGQVAGGLAAGLLMSFVQDRYGPLKHIRVVAALAALPPVLALGAERLATPMGDSILYFYIVVFFFLGLYVGSQGWPYFNWILEYAGETKRPLYIGMINTFSALVTLAPALGGWVVDAISYRAVFALSLVFVVITLWLSRCVPDPRYGQPAAG